MVEAKKRREEENAFSMLGLHASGIVKHNSRQGGFRFSKFRPMIRSMDEQAKATSAAYLRMSSERNKWVQSVRTHPCSWQKELAALRNMGFADEALNIRVLSTGPFYGSYHGCTMTVEKAVQKLTKLQAVFGQVAFGVNLDVPPSIAGIEFLFQTC